MKTFMPPPPAATFLAFHPEDNNIVAIGMDDSTIQIYNVRTDEVCYHKRMVSYYLYVLQKCITCCFTLLDLTVIAVCGIPRLNFYVQPETNLHILILDLYSPFIITKCILIGFYISWFS